MLSNCLTVIDLHQAHLWHDISRSLEERVKLFPQDCECCSCSIETGERVLTKHLI